MNRIASFDLKLSKVFQLEENKRKGCKFCAVVLPWHSEWTVKVYIQLIQDDLQIIAFLHFLLLDKKLVVQIWLVCSDLFQ